MENENIEEQYSNTSPDGERGHFQNVPQWVVVVVFLLVVGLVTLFFLKVNERGGKLTSDLEGSIYISLSAPDEKVTDIYAFNLESNSLDEVFENKGEYARYASKVSPAGNKIAYMAYLPLSGEFPQLYIYDVDTEGISQLTSASSRNKRLPSWSPNGTSIAFTAHFADLNDEERLDPNNWGIAIARFNAKVRPVGLGTYPMWSPDGSVLLFLKKDGLYVYNIESRDISKAFTLPWGGEADTTMKLSVSSDGTRLAWSNYYQQEILLFKINSWSPFDMEHISVIETPEGAPFQSVFSPDGNYLAVKKAGWDAELETRIDPQIAVYDLETFKSIKVFDLTEYNWGYFYLTDWR